MATLPVVLLTDFGTRDVYVGVMKGVVAGIAPAAPVIDLTHEVSPQDVRGAACALLFGYRYFPAGTVFCCVVDPGVGTARQPVAIEIEGADGPVFLVCPDNGLATPLLPLAVGAVVLDDPRYHLPSVSSTFHGRDLFAPAAAHLAAGTRLESLGSSLSTDRLVSLPWPQPNASGEGWLAQVIHVDRFGNLITNLAGEELGTDSGGWRVRLGDRTIGGISPTFAAVEVGSPVAYIGSSGFLELAVRQGNAAGEWRAGIGSEVRVERANE